MPPTATEAGPIDVTFTGALTQGGVNAPGSWTVVVMTDSAEVFGTRQPVKVAGTMDGHPFAATLLPLGDGTHILPVKAAVRKAIGKGAGDDVAIHLQHRH
ncbi:DUF1905 domain-containing protein [Jiangella alkaliphila]|uniref:DUF1905 domain-containing protein n=1 Tax=Jiangella alkaliphila TaxID=419479 RepID=A0A1H2L9W0_9ACTN|nr:DUF1905 domain-containing protein [Jiangella alkaliphila]SDU77793.1 protein of unknown function [Jiangella alkaliphila]